MKKLLLVLLVVTLASFLLVGCFGTTPAPDEVVTIAAIHGVTAPVTGATPVAAITATSQYTGVVTWSPVDATFAAATVYTAMITLTPVTGFTLTGVAVDFFTVTGATAANLVDSGVVTAVFPATEAAPVTPVAPTLAAIPDAIVGWDDEPWTYQAVATPGTGADLTYSLSGDPIGMSISATGLITWAAILDEEAIYEVTVTVDAGDGTTPATDTFVIHVIAPEDIPSVYTATLAVTDEYINAGGKIYVPNGTGVDVTVTFTESVEVDYMVYIARKTDAGLYIPANLIEATPNAARTIWTVEDVDFKLASGIDADECESFCLVAVVKDPCCPGEEVALEVVSVDTIAPDIPEFIFDCGDCNACEDTCEPEGAYFTFTSLPVEVCDVADDTCDDACSGVGSWSFKIDPDGCDECVLAVGSGCPVAGTTDCGCLPWASGEANHLTETYNVVFTIADNVGNEDEETYYITVDTDEVIYCIGEGV